MATFFSDLWESIFTPGPTPPVLVAVNVSCAALQLLFLGLLAATHSVHFIVLSFLSACLWYSINWFSREVLAAQAESENNAADKPATSDASSASASSAGVTSTDRSAADAPSKNMGVGASTVIVGKEDQGGDHDEEASEDTEVEATNERGFKTARLTRRAKVGMKHVPKGEASASTGTATEQQQQPQQRALRQRPARKQQATLADSTGELSTDSEWEKVDEA